MNILITGGRGFVGRHLYADLVAHKHNVTSFDIVDGQDIRNLHDLDKTFEYTQCSLVIHLAARAGVRRSTEYPHEYLTTNIEGTWNVGKMCEKYGCSLISFSSSSVYGDATPPVKETDRMNPISLYGTTKLCAEHIVNQLSVPTTIIRPFTIYGEDGRGDQVFYKWLNQYKSGRPVTVFDSKESSRGYTYIGDIVGVILHLTNMCWEWKEDFNIGGPEVITINDLKDIFEENIPGFKKRMRILSHPDSDIGVNYADYSKAQKMLGYHPKPQFRQLVSRIIQSELTKH